MDAWLRAHRWAAGRIGDGKDAGPDSVGNGDLGKGREYGRCRRYREEDKMSHYRDGSWSRRASD